MLSGLAACAALTAVLAGIAGAWSPCGFSMVETIGSAMGDTRRTATWAASTTFTLGAVIGGIVTFAGLALLGGLLGAQAGGAREGIGAVLALAAAIADWRGLKVAPQIRRQVPERWRWTQPLPLACGLYGILLGLGFTTFVLAFAVWALAGISFASGDPALGALVGVGFGLGRAAPVLLMAPSFRGSGDGAKRLEGIAIEPRLWLGLRRLDALGLGLCALFLSGASATAASLPAAFDPSAAGAELVWQQLTGPAVLRLASGQTMSLPGSDPAIGGSHIAWLNDAVITVADSSSLAAVAMVPVAGVDALATSASWVVYRAAQSAGGERLVGLSLGSPASPRFIAQARLDGELGRPALSGSRVVFTIDTPHRSELEMIDLASGARQILRSSRRESELQNPSLLAGKLLYEQIDRCAQRLLLGPAHAGSGGRVLLRLASTSSRDPGYQPGYTHAYNTASLCPRRATGPGAKLQLGPTALSSSTAYVTELQPAKHDARILLLRR